MIIFDKMSPSFLGQTATWIACSLSCLFNFYLIVADLYYACTLQASSFSIWYVCCGPGRFVLDDSCSIGHCTRSNILQPFKFINEYHSLWCFCYVLFLILFACLVGFEFWQMFLFVFFFVFFFFFFILFYWGCPTAFSVLFWLVLVADVFSSSSCQRWWSWCWKWHQRPASSMLVERPIEAFAT